MLVKVKVIGQGLKDHSEVTNQVVSNQQLRGNPEEQAGDFQGRQLLGTFDPKESQTQSVSFNEPNSSARVSLCFFQHRTSLSRLVLLT